MTTQELAQKILDTMSKIENKPTSAQKRALHSYWNRHPEEYCTPYYVETALHDIETLCKEHLQKEGN